METSVLHTGRNGAYHWLSVTADAHMMNLLDAIPEAFCGRHVAITSFDSGSMRPDAKERENGWRNAGGIVWTPVLQSDNLKLLRSCCSGEYDEWYLFSKPRELGTLFQGNPFEGERKPGNPVAWVTYPAFALHEPALADEFWRQIEWMQPESYLSDGHQSLHFATRDQALFDRVLAYFTNLSYT